MKKTIYKAVAYQKGNTGRKGPVKMVRQFSDISFAIIELQKWIYLHEDLYYYSIERTTIIKNE